MPLAEKLPPAALEALMRYYADCGVDCILAETTLDRFTDGGDADETAGRANAAPDPTAKGHRARPGEAGGTSPPASHQPLATGDAAVSDEAALLDARAAAAEASDLESLRRTLEAFDGCHLRFSAKNLVFADGNPAADIMFIGEAPGRQEDLEGLPFVGRAGRLLDRMLAAIGLDRGSAYITNMIPWRPPGNRTPAPHEIELCRAFIERHIVLAAPKIVVFLGNVSTKALLGTNRGILSIRGNWSELTLGETVFAAMPTLHPAYLLRNPAHKRLAWQDFLELRLRLDAIQSAND